MTISLSDSCYPDNGWGVVNRAKTCKLKLGDRLLSLDVGGNRFHVIAICNPVDFYLGDVPACRSVFKS